MVVEETITGVHGVLTVYENRDKLRPFFRKLQYLPVSLLIENMKTTPDELLAKTTAGYDAHLQEASIEKLLNTIVEMASH